MTKRQELFIRTRSAIIFAAIMLTGICWNFYSYLALMAFIMLASFNEFHNVVKPVQGASKVSGWYKAVSGIIALFIFCTAFGLSIKVLPPNLLLLIPALLFLVFIVELFGESKTPFTNIAFNILGLIYLCLPFAALHFVVFRGGIYQYKMVLAILFLIWANDSFAYLTGSRIGRHKMLPRISPGKTWEGFAGGVAGAAIISVILNYTFKLYFLDIADWLCIGVIISIASTLGDLVESMLKRSLNIKDTGSIMPGHGGILDRFDAFYFAVPFVALYLVLAGKL